MIMSHPEKNYHPAEELWNVATHLGGLAVMAGCGILLLLRCSTTVAFMTALIYAASLLCVYASSGFYHLAKDRIIRERLRLCDHAAIYLLIAGTYTPLMIIAVGGVAGWSVLAVNWILAAIGIIFEIAGCKPFKGFTILLYITMGWLCVAVAGRMISALDTQQLLFLVAGGVAYTAGVPFYLAKWKYAHAVWHVWVLAGSLLQFISVIMMIKPQLPG